MNLLPKFGRQIIVGVFTKSISWIIFSLLYFFSRNIVLSVGFAACISAAFNFEASRRLVFGQPSRSFSMIKRYWLMIIAGSILDALVISLYCSFGFSVYFSKFLSIATLTPLTFLAAWTWVFVS